MEMALVPKRRDSKELPPDLSELMNKLIEHARSFIGVFDSREPRMREIEGKFHKIADKVKAMQKVTDKVRTGGAVGGGIGLGVAALGLIVAPFTGGLSLVAATAIGGAVGAAVGGAVVVGTNITKTMTENGSATEVVILGEEFLKIVEPMKNDLEEIKTTCEKLEQKSSEVQTRDTLSDVEKLQRILRQVSELRTKSEDVVDIAVVMTQAIQNMVLLFVNILRPTATPKEDKKLTDSIINSADQCQKVVSEFNGMKKELEDLTGKSEDVDVLK